MTGAAANRAGPVRTAVLWHEGGSPRLAGRQLLLDVSAIASADAGTGIQRVVRAAVLALQHMKRSELRPRLIAADRTTSYRYLPDDWLWQGRRRESLDLANRPVVEAAADDVFLGLDFAASILPRHERQIAAWRKAGVRVHVVVYDLLPLLSPGWFRLPMRRNFRRWLRVIERQADQFITISVSVAAEIERWQHRPRMRRVPPVEVVSIHLSGDIAGSAPTTGLPSEARAILAWMRRRATVLVVGTIEPRKGHKAVLAAFDRLWGKNVCSPQLLLVGRPGWKTRRLQRLLRKRSGLSGPLLWLDDVTDEFLQKLYPESAGVLMASEGEGFGLPLLEALAHDRSVLVRDIPVFRELERPGLNYFDCDRPAALADAISRWIASPGAPGSLVGSTQTWADTADELLRALGVEGSASVNRRHLDGSAPQ